MVLRFVYLPMPKASWSEPSFFPQVGQYAAPENRDKRITIDRAANFDNPLFEGPDVPDNAYFDGLVTDEAIATLNAHVDRREDQPFFLMVGLFKDMICFVGEEKERLVWRNGRCRPCGVGPWILKA